MRRTPGSRGDVGRWLVVVCAAVGLCVAAADYLSHGNGIDHTDGALLVTVSTILILGASILLALRLIPSHWARVGIDVLILLGVLGTAAAAYFLEADLLLGLMVLALCSWLAAVLPARTLAARAHAEAGIGR
jgi:hypothetical protein